MVARIFVRYETRSDSQSLHGPMWDQIAMLLTGLKFQQIEELGGIQIFDSGELKVIAILRSKS
jgi:hypothetical protein